MAIPKMSDDTKSHNFGEHHQRHVRTTFQYIDKLLSEAEHTMTDAGEGAPTPSDTSEIQKDLWILREWETADAMPQSGN
jgi:hypothetical protein